MLVLLALAFAALAVVGCWQFVGYIADRRRARRRRREIETLESLYDSSDD
ncbi:MAG: hypothetical protein R3A49_06985 [Acidimicrobiia bacterium]